MMAKFIKLTLACCCHRWACWCCICVIKGSTCFFCFLGSWYRKLIGWSFPGKHTNLTGWMNGFWLVIHMWSLVRSLESAYSVGGTNLSVFNQYQRTTKLPRLSSYKNQIHSNAVGESISLKAPLSHTASQSFFKMYLYLCEHKQLHNMPE